MSTGADNFEWNFGDGNTSNSSTTVSNMYGTPGSYTVSLHAWDATSTCADDTSATILVNPPPQFTVIGDSICPTDVALLKVEPTDSANTWNFVWSPSSLVVNPSGDSTYTINDTSIYYSVTVTSSVGCQATDSAFVYVLTPLAPDAGDTTVIIGDSVPIPVEYLNSYNYFNWDPTDGLSCLDCSYPIAGPLLEDITYTVTFGDGCSEGSYTYVITVKPETKINLPTTFTPNGDGINDIIFIGYWGVKELLYFQIYNRWGELMFETTDINQGWDGYFRGKLQNNDIYVYKVKVTTWLDTEIYKEGHIHLMR